MYGQTLKDCFAKSCLINGEKVAISFIREGAVETDISYQELNRDSNRMANFLLSSGIRKGDRVILYFPKSLGFIIVHLALQKMGAIAVPLNPGFRQSEMEYLLEDTGAKLVLSGTEQEAIIRKISSKPDTLVIPAEKPYGDLDFFRLSPDSEPGVDIRPENPGLIIYTSGTTGNPKGAVLTQKNLVYDARNIIDVWNITEPDTICHALPLFHIHGLSFALHTALMVGAHVSMLDEFSPKKVIDLLSINKGENVCTVFMAVPSMYAKMMDCLGDENRDFGHIRLWTSGSAPLLPKDFEKIKMVFGKEPLEREGMSETGMNFSNPLNEIRKPGSIGLPMPGLQVRIVEPRTFEDVATGDVGEILLKGPAVTPGYWQKPEETKRAFIKGWFRTGDLGRVDDDGYYYLTDRIKHIIISGGENISPKEVETVINQLEGVVESSVVGVPDKEWGEKVVAAVATKPGLRVKAEKIQEQCKEHLHKWKSPKEIIFVKELPKNRMGKILKEEVKKLFCFK